MSVFRPEVKGAEESFEMRDVEFSATMIVFLGSVAMMR